jgi:hypothetical protein
MTSQLLVLDVLVNKFSELLLEMDHATLQLALLCQRIIMAWQCISPQVTVKGLKNAVYSIQWTGLMM